MGATGAQGGGLARAILADSNGPFALRAITRNPASDKAKALADQGAEVVAADADDPASLVAAFTGAHGAFCVTNFWEHFSTEREIAQAKAMADAARTAGIAHVVWSTLEDMRKFVPLDDTRMPTLQGKYKVPHFDAKGEADAFFADLPTTYMMAAFYWENFIYFGMGPRRGPDGKAMLVMPLGGALLPGIAAGDIGGCAYGMFKAGPATIGEKIGVAGEILTGEAMAAGISRAVGEPVSFYDMPFDDYRALGFPGADDVGNMFHVQAIINEHFVAARDVTRSRALNPNLQSFDTWLANHGASIKIG